MSGQYQLTIRFLFDKDFLSKLIGWSTNSLWCHVEMLSEDGQSWIGAHAGKGVQARPLDYCNPSREKRYLLNVTKDQYIRAIAFAKSHIGQPYDYLDIAGLFIHDRHLNNDHAAICSAFMFDLLWSINILALNVLPGWSYLITPETLHLSTIFMGRCVFTKGFDEIRT